MRAGRPAITQRASQGAARGSRAGRTTSGPSGSASQRGTWRSMPGSAIGTAVSGLSIPALPKEAPPAGPSWRVDETYVKIRGEWVYLYMAVDREGMTVDFHLSPRRDVAATKAFFCKAMKGWGLLPRTVTFGRLCRIAPRGA